MAMEFLSQRKIPYTAKDIREDPEALEELRALGSRSTPTIVVDGEVLVGFEPEKLLAKIRA
jgi:glutaredoxin